MTTYPVTAVKRAADVVEVLRDHGSAGVTAVANALDVPKSTAHDHLRTLERVGYAVNEGGTYRLSLGFLHVGEVVRNQHELFRHGRDQAIALADAVGESKYVQLVTAEHGRAAILFAPRAQGGRDAPGATPYPRRPHLHTNAPGKAILAHEDDETVAEIMADHGLPQWTSDTITDEDALLAALDRIHESGIAVDQGEVLAGMRGVAAPVVTGDTVHGAIAVYAASGGFETDLVDSRFADLVREAADEIEANVIFARQ